MGKLWLSSEVYDYLVHTVDGKGNKYLARSTIDTLTLNLTVGVRIILQREFSSDEWDKLLKLYNQYHRLINKYGRGS